MPDVTDDVISTLTPYLLTSSLSQVLLNATLRRAQMARASVTKNDLPKLLAVLEELLPTYLVDARRRAECVDKLRRLVSARTGASGSAAGAVPAPVASTPSLASPSGAGAGAAARPAPFGAAAASPNAHRSPFGGASPSGATASRPTSFGASSTSSASSNIVSRPASSVASSGAGSSTTSTSSTTGSAASSGPGGTISIGTGAKVQTSGTERILVHNGEDVRKASGSARDTSARVGFSPVDQTKIATAASELARNILLYAKSGEVQVSAVDAPKRGVEIIAIDQGPGIGNVDLVLGTSYKSRTGMGMGLKGTKRLMDDFELQTAPGKGTTVTIRKYL